MNNKNIAILITLLISISFLISCGSDDREPEQISSLDSSRINNGYGLNVGSLNEFKSVVKKGETLSDILLPFGLEFSAIVNIAEASKEIFDVKKIQSDKKYTVYTTSDSTRSMKYFIYENDPVNFVVYDLSDSLRIYKDSKEVTIKERRVTGIIDNSLYMTLKDKNVSDLLALKLSEVFAWQIDFYRLQKGDLFKVIFEEKFIDNEFVGIGKIVAAQFNHWGSDYFAFYYNQNNYDEYFDENGKSLRKTFLKAPLKFSRISSGYSKKRFHPVLKKYKPHLGTDYAAPKGIPILSVGDGVVIEAQYKRNNGNYVKIRHNSVYTTQYLHMSKIKRGIKVGKTVKQGDEIGFVGSTGLATGPHVCFRFWKNGQQVNHRREKFPSILPVDEDNMDNYLKMMNYEKSILEILPIESIKTQLANQ